MSKKSNEQIIEELENRFVVKPGFAKAGRYIIRQGALTKLGREKQQQNYVFFLFNDMIAYGTLVPVVNRYKLNQKIDITTNVHVRLLAPVDGKSAFLLCSPEKTFVVLAKDKDSCESWAKSISWTLDMAKKKPSPKVPVATLPTWIQISDISNAHLIFPNLSVSSGPGKASRAPTRSELEGKQDSTSRGPLQLAPSALMASNRYYGNSSPNSSPRGGARPVIPPRPGKKPDFGSKFGGSVTLKKTPPPIGGGGASKAFCGNCGKDRLSGNWKFCDMCGKGF